MSALASGAPRSIGGNLPSSTSARRRRTVSEKKGPAFSIPGHSIAEGPESRATALRGLHGATLDCSPPRELKPRLSILV